jgi:hypothetical protein
VNNNRELALSLLMAESETEAIDLLKAAGYWDDADAWRMCGDMDGNFATIGNQQARPEAALVEKLVNSVDARLMNECLEAGIDPESEKAPHSIPHAISVLFDGKPPSTTTAGTIADWTQKKQLEQARHITVAVTGNKPRQGMPCITIADSGEGQSPGRFPDTFLSINKANKLRIPFVQGKFNMGGTGALKFCGKHSLQLVISRRNPRIIELWKGKGSKWTSSDSRDKQWGFTIVRRERPTGGAGEVRNSIFRYLAPVPSPDGFNYVLSFDGTTLPMFPEENRPYVRESGHGTVIKLYEYDVKGFGSQALMKGGLLSRLEALLPQIALPVRMHECRQYRGEEARSFANSLVGLTVRLGENRGDNLEEGYPTTASFVVRNERMTAQIYAFKDDKAESYRTNEGIIFAINGQTHGAIPKTFFERTRVKMGRLAKSLIIMVDCTAMSVGAREDLFMNSRDRLSNGELRKEIEEELEDIIGKHPGLRELRERRRTEEIASRLEESKPLEHILDSILKTSPTLSRLFLFGQRLSRPNRAEMEDKPGGGQGKEGGDATFEPKPHPTYFRFHKKRYGEMLQRSAEIDRRCRIRFETDAQNDYFERAHLPGSYDLDVIDGALEGANLPHSVTIHDGIANWSIKLPDDQVEVGDKVTIQCTVKDDTLLEAFVNVATITVTAHEEQDRTSTKSRRLTNKSGGANSEGGTGPTGADGTNRAQGGKLTGGIDLPEIIPVHRDDDNWKRHEFDDSTACRVIEDDKDGQSAYSFYVNIDNLYLQTEMKEGREDVALQRTKFVWGNVLIGLALIHDSKQRPQKGSGSDSESDSNTDTVFSQIAATTRALGPFLIPMIDHLGAITEEDVVVLAQRGDDE